VEDRSTRETIDLEEPYMYFEACMDMVDSGELTRDEAFAKYQTYFGLPVAAETVVELPDDL